MNLEGANGKNPVYHVGKLYNLAAGRVAERLHELTGDYAEVHLISATGMPLGEPWRVLVRLTASDVDEETVAKTVAEILTDFPALTAEILDHGVVMA
jgi:S-adenosylmethionine synthetase